MGSAHVKVWVGGRVRAEHAAVARGGGRFHRRRWDKPAPTGARVDGLVWRVAIAPAAALEEEHPRGAARIQAELSMLGAEPSRHLAPRASAVAAGTVRGSIPPPAARHAVDVSSSNMTPCRQSG